jgi:peptide subunit release factor RF-3
MRNVLWNWSDEDAVKIIKTFVPILKQAPGTVLLVNDGISPVYKAMSNNLLKPYRRRDVTVMTMHNTRQRTEAQWAELFKKADDGLQVRKEPLTYPPYQKQ